MTEVDINSDMGESFGAWSMRGDEDLLKIVTSANVACGFHAGDPLVMHRTVKNALEAGVGVGAHPGFQDLQGFGRRQIRIDNFVELEKMMVYQLGALIAIAGACGHKVTHVKYHGAVAHQSFADRDVADALVRAVKSVDRDMLLLVVPCTELEIAAGHAGMPVAREIFADRAYDDRGMLVPRKMPGAVISDPETASGRVLRMLEERALISESGKRIPVPIDSICVHGDTPGAVAMARMLRQRLEQAGVSIVPMHRGTFRNAG
jgi:UPF0271 protein